MSTTLTRSPFTDIRERIDRAFDDLLSGERHPWAPAIDVVESDDHLKLRADVPGMAAEDIKIEVENGVLTISGEHEEVKEDKDERYVRRERRYGSFGRSMVLPKGTDPSALQATYKDGVLELTMPCAKAAGEQKIEIKPKAA